MPKRRTHNDNDRFANEDNPIGLTGAFAPVKGPQSVDYDVNDNPVGLTGAFGAVTVDEEDRPWDEAGKWKDFDWDAALGEPAEFIDPKEAKAQEAAARDTGDAAENTLVAKEAEAAPSEPAREAEPESAPEPAAKAKPEPKPAAESTPEKRVEAAKPAEKSAEKPVQSAASTPAKSGPKHGRHAAAKPELSPRMKKSRRTRRVLIVLVILLIIVLAALGYFMYRTFSNSQQEAAQQAQEQVAAPKDEIKDAPAVDAAEPAKTQQVDVPNLTTLMHKSQDDAIKELGRGALITANREVNEEGNPIKVELNVALTEEPADSKTGTPTVYLSLGEDGTVRQVGYSASASALGFGSLSFADAVNNEHVVEKTLEKVGVKVPEGSAVLPANKDEYSTYASDGTTVMRERSSFEGDTEVNGVPATWSAALSYDYTTQVVTGNLNDTVRIIYVYLTEKMEAPQEQPPAEPAE